jgi:hypothetical protein
VLADACSQAAEAARLLPVDDAAQLGVADRLPFADFAASPKARPDPRWHHSRRFADPTSPLLFLRPRRMDVFQFRNQIIDDYSRYVSSFIAIAQPKLLEFVNRCFGSGSLWPDPLIQLNPTFKPGKSIDDLVRDGVLATGCGQVFRRDKADAAGSGMPLLLHQHQEDAVRKARESRNYVLTTGTGSGKSLSYIVPIVDHVLRAGSGRGIGAIIIYPMNALANSQFGELEKFLKLGFPAGRGPVTFERYTGQEDQETRDRIITTPPDILLTNYVMLELILTRPHESKLIASAQGLKFLVLDELHTYRGRQGADVAILLRRVRELLNAQRMQCVGTSATLAGRGSWEGQCQDVAKLATRFFGDTVEASDIIGETLERATLPLDETNAADVTALTTAVATGTNRPLNTFEELAADPVARWVEGTFGIVPRDGRLVRSPSIPLTGDRGAAERLRQLTGADFDRCKDVIAETLLAGATRVRHPRTGFPVFAFRLHQFISRGDTLYATLESPEERFLTIYGQLYSPQDRNKVLLPLCFCRECGQEYYSVYLAHDTLTGEQRFLPREAHERTEVPGQRQPRKDVRVLTYYGTDNQIDGIVLDVLLRKHQTIRNSLGVSVPMPVDSEQIVKAVFEGLLLRGKAETPAKQQLLPTFEEFFKPQKQLLHEQWEAVADREQRHRTMFAQESIKFDEVAAELAETERAIGSPAELADFFRSTLTLSGAVVNDQEFGEPGGVSPRMTVAAQDPGANARQLANAVLKADLTGVKPAVREALGGAAKLQVAFEPVSTKGVTPLHRTHPLVEGLAAYVLNSALDPLLGGLARRAGVIRSKAVRTRTVLLLLRLRFHIVTTTREEERHLLAEDALLVAFTGEPTAPQWVPEPDAESLLAIKPDANVPPDIAVQQLESITAHLAELAPQLDAFARARGQQLLESHRRVRSAAGARGSYRIDHNPPDVLGVYVFLPVVRL